MQFSEYFKLESFQDFEFFDINVFLDTKQFVDPYAICQVDSITGNYAKQCLDGFMSELLQAIKKSNRTYAESLCQHFSEPTGTRFGYSKINYDGHGAGLELSSIFLNQLYKVRELVDKDYLATLEDTLFVCDGIGNDTISDITINIVKHALIQFTQEQCHKYGIPMKLSKKTLDYFCVSELKWKTEKFALPHMIDNDNVERYIILIPKRFVPDRPIYNLMYFYNNVAQERFKEQALAKNSTCVSRSKAGELRVLTKDLKQIDEFKPIKQNMRSLILSYPSVLNEYRQKVAWFIYKKSFG